MDTINYLKNDFIMNDIILFYLIFKGKIFLNIFIIMNSEIFLLYLLTLKIFLNDK